MRFTKLKVVMVLLVVAALSGSAGLIYQIQAAEQPKGQRATAKADEDEKPRPDKERLQGTWKLICKDKGFVDGEWTIKGTTIKVAVQMREEKEPEDRTWTWYHRFRLDETTNPKRIVLIEGEADDLFDIAQWDKQFDDVNQQSEGIYSIDGDNLKICVSPCKANGRPTSFESKKHILIVLKRETPRSCRNKGDKSAKPSSPTYHPPDRSIDKP